MTKTNDYILGFQEGKQAQAEISFREGRTQTLEKVKKLIKKQMDDEYTSEQEYANNVLRKLLSQLEDDEVKE
jgi:(p)ppGpp synthase/HD superfamily hydrolase